MSDPTKILGIDLNRSSQAAIAEVMNKAGFVYRFISEPRKTLGALQQLQPNLLVLFDELGSDCANEVLDAVASDVQFAHLPIVLVAKSAADAPFCAGLRTGVVSVLPQPFDHRHPGGLKVVIAELPNRQGSTSGTADSKTLARLVEHLRRARRSGELTFDPRTINEGRAAFVMGKLESAQYQKLAGIEALVAMVAQPQAQWNFAEMHGAGGDGAGVVIEVPPVTRSQEIAAVQAAPTAPAPPPPPPEVTQPFEMPFTPAGGQPSPVGAAGATLLLVDDDDSLCDMFSRLFTKHGFAVKSAEDGLEGFAAAQAGGYDAVIADLNMPRMDGWGMLRMLRDDFRTRELPVAFLSCHDDYREALRALNSGAQAYFSKGTRLDALVGQVRKLLEPRVHTVQQIAAGRDFQCDIGAVGQQWLLGELEDCTFSGRITCQDSFAGYQVFFREGRCVHATAVAGPYAAEGERAFNAIIGSRNAQGAVRFGNFETPQTLFHPTSTLIARACETLTYNERKMREDLLVAATELEINEDLYAIYRQVGPRQWLELARLICEERVPPREVIARLETSPVEVEETMKDLLRRGVVTLKGA